MTIKAQRAIIEYVEGITVDGYMMPDGEFRIGMVGASLALGYAENWLYRLTTREGKALEALQGMGFSNEFVSIECDAINGGGHYAQTISTIDFDILTAFAASEGKRDAMRLLSKNPKIERATALEPRIKRVLSSKQVEKKIQNNLSKTLINVKTEVPTLAGRIDILTDTQLIEVKEWKRWKEAIGQVLCYGAYYPNHEKRIHFFGEAHIEFIQLVEHHCQNMNIIMSWEPE
ncbi:hypothetical protein [Planktothrix agardhii]|uniref:hypothetical protein n=1 Tax=Planktothrix agardhii TaxID=1160 RepID=UPI0028B172EE|nr:hypothetical protein [Planktothrix agardhii]